MKNSRPFKTLVSNFVVFLFYSCLFWFFYEYNHKYFTNNSLGWCHTSLSEDCSLFGQWESPDLSSWFFFLYQSDIEANSWSLSHTNACHLLVGLFIATAKGFQPSDQGPILFNNLEGSCEPAFWKHKVYETCFQVLAGIIILLLSAFNSCPAAFHIALQKLQSSVLLGAEKEDCCSLHVSQWSKILLSYKHEMQHQVGLR